MMQSVRHEKKRVLYTRGLCKTFSAGNTQQKVLEDLDLEIYKGDFTVIMGNSGSGKSTLLYALSGMDRPSGGEITYETGDGRKTMIIIAHRLNTIEKCDVIYEVKDEKIAPTSLEGRTVIH